MPGRCVTPQSLEKEYTLFKKLISHSPDLPDRWEDWSVESTIESGRLQALGFDVSPIVVESAKFAKYCEDAGIEPTYEFLRAYAKILDSWMQ